MNISKEDLKAERHRLGPDGQADLRAAVRYTGAVHVDTQLLEALGSRESNMMNIIGDGGHGRGMYQLDDRYQQPYLHGHRGCRNGSNTPAYSNALAPGRVPTIFAGAAQACRIIEANIVYAKHAGVPYGEWMKFALSAYNAGLGGAEKGFKEGDSDRYTTGHDYAKDVLERRDALAKM